MTRLALLLVFGASTFAIGCGETTPSTPPNAAPVTTGGSDKAKPNAKKITGTPAPSSTKAL